MRAMATEYFFMAQLGQECFERLLPAEGIPFGECFIETDRACAQRYVRAGAQATPTVLVGGRPVLGLDPARMLQLLETERP